MQRCSLFIIHNFFEFLCQLFLLREEETQRRVGGDSNAMVESEGRCHQILQQRGSDAKCCSFLTGVELRLNTSRDNELINSSHNLTTKILQKRAEKQDEH